MAETWDAAGNVPDHKWLRGFDSVGQLAAAIEVGQVTVGTRLPSERALADHFGCSRTLVRTFLKDLEQRGLVVTRRGRAGGTFITSGPLVRSLNYITTGTVLVGGATDGGCRVVGARVRSAPGVFVTRAFGGVEYEAVVEIERVRYVGKDPVSWERVWLPSPRCEKLLEMDLGGSINTLLEQECGFRFAASTEHLEATLATPEDAEILGVSVGDPVMEIHRISRDDQGQVIECGADRFVGSRVRFEVCARRGPHTVMPLGDVVEVEDGASPAVD